MAAHTLVICNGAPYGDERLYNGLRLALSLARRVGAGLKLFLIGDAVLAAKAGQQLPEGYYNLGRMIRAVAKAGGEVGVCGTCLDARGIADGPFVEGVQRGSMDQLTDWTEEAERVVVF